MKRTIFFFVIIFLGGCATPNISVSYATQTVGTVTNASEQVSEKTKNQSDKNIATKYVSLSETEIAAGLTPEIKGYIYGMDALADYTEGLYTKTFDDETKDYDLNGDGVNDVIKLKGKDIESKEGGTIKYNKLSVNIDGQILILRPEPGYLFENDEEGMPGEVVDINKNDNKKELIVIMYTSSCLAKEYIIVYDNSIPMKIGSVDSGFINPKFVNGSGFIVVFDKVIDTNTSVFKIMKLKEDRSGFIEVPVSLYRTEYTSYKGNTKFDVLLSSSPEEIPNFELKSGTEVTVGYYDPKDYIEIRTSAGTIGWLNLQGQGMEYLNKLFDDTIGT